ncbi:2-oxoglutarate/malate translocator [Haematococcus lacustris]
MLQATQMRVLTRRSSLPKGQCNAAEGWARRRCPFALRAAGFHHRVNPCPNLWLHQTPQKPQVQVAAASAASAGDGSVQQPATNGAVPSPPSAPAAPIGVKVVPALQAIAVGLAIRFLAPIPAGVSEQGWTLLSIFVTTILGLVLDPLPVGAWAFIAITVTLATKTLTFAQAFSAMTNEVIWLIVVSFFFAKGFEKTGLGERIANLFVRAMGKSTLGLSYGLNVAEALLAPAMPSTSARAGGIFMPIIKSLSQAAGSNPGDSSRLKMGAFLTQSQFQSGIHSSSLFLTASAQNLLCLNLAAELGAEVPNQFFQWMAGAALPSLIGMLITPWLVFKLCPPSITDTPEAPLEAGRRLQDMGPMSRDEKLMLGTMGLAVALWVVGPSVGISAVLAAMLGLCVLLCTGVLSWRDCLTYVPAWDTLCWFAVLIGMSGQLNSLGVIKAFADHMGGALTSLNMSWMPLFGLLHVLFFGLHYMFASQTAHVGALYSAFCAMMLSAGVPPVLAAMTLAYSINLFGSLTHYASGQAAVFYGSGFMSLPEVFKIGAVNGFLGLGLWACLGMPVWKLLGWW